MHPPVKSSCRQPRQATIPIMRVLKSFRPTPEQLLVINDVSPGVVLIKGAAGSGKTSTALLRLKFLSEFWLSQVEDGYVDPPVRILLLTFNRTLRGYVAELARGQINDPRLSLEIDTFGGWSLKALGGPHIIDDGQRGRILAKLGTHLPWDAKFTADESEYVMGRFMPNDLDAYLEAKRSGRGVAPRVDRPLRQRFLDEVVRPYQELKQRSKAADWNDLAVTLAGRRLDQPLHVVIVDESQDFSANQVRALMNNVVEQHTVTFVMDAAQRIYPQGFAWREAGITIDASNSYLLKTNHRNTRQIAAFCAPLIADIEISDDGSIPDLHACTRDGAKPVVVAGRFSRQMSHVLSAVTARAGSGESTAILHPLGGGWFDEVRRRLHEAGVAFVEMTRLRDWPAGPEDVALCTMASAKGLEFDHVCIIGLNAEVTPHGVDEGDSRLENYLRMFAMAGARARETLMVGYKPEEASALVRYLDPDTYTSA